MTNYYKQMQPTPVWPELDQQPLRDMPMIPVKPCGTYDARPSGTAVYRAGQTAFKIYYVDIVGRPQRERYEWEHCGRERESLLDQLKDAAVEGVGAILAFPHITKVFRFAPSAEIIMHVRAFATPDFSEVNLVREEGYLEFACYAEAIVAAEEYRFWAEAASVEEYLEQWCHWTQAAVADHTKLGRYLGRQG